MMSPSRSGSGIRRRLTLLYAGTLLLVLLGAATTLRFAIRATLEQQFVESVQSSGLLVRQFFRTEIAEFREVEVTLAHIAGEMVFEDRTIRILRPDGSEFIPPSARARVQPVTGPSQVARTMLDPALAPGWQIEIEAGKAALHALEARIDRWFIIGIPALVVLAAVAGWWLTGRTLAPVAVMADATSVIEPGSRRRLPIGDPGDELGRLGSRFNALLDRLDRALVQQREFLEDAAHELRTPIARMRARVELALLSSRSPAARHADASGTHALLEALDDELQRVSAVVDQAMELARADTEVSKEAMFLDDVVADELQRWYQDAQRREVTLACSLLDEAPVSGNPVQLARVLGILVDNALRYSRAGGHVDVRVRTIHDEGRATRVLLEVEDAGIGIREDERAQLFARFFRGREARALRPEGSGLGLAMAAMVAAQHGGALSLEPTRAHGTLALFSLPAADDQEMTSSRKERPNPNRQPWERDAGERTGAADSQAPRSAARHREAPA